MLNRPQPNQTPRLDDLLDVDQVQAAVDAHFRASGMPLRVVGATDGRTLAGAGQPDVELRFHCALTAGHGIVQPIFAAPDDPAHDDTPQHRRCAVGVWTISLPIRVADDHVATLLLGQFRYSDEDPDENSLKNQAARCGFSLDTFAGILARVPRFSRTQVDAILAYDTALAAFLSRRAAERHPRRRERPPVAAPRPRELVETQCQFDAVMQAAGIGYYDYYPQRGDGFLSPAWLGMLGYRADELPHTYETFDRLLHPDDRDGIHRAVETGIASGDRFRLVFRAMHKDGTHRWIESCGRTLEWNDRGRPARVLGVNLDVTGREEQAELIRCFKTISDSIGDQHYVTDHALRIRQANRAFLDAFEVTRDQAIGRHPWELSHVAERGRVRSGLERCLTGETDVQEFWYQFRNRSPGYYRISRYPVRDPDGAVSGVAVSIHDLTEIQQVREELRTANKALATTGAELQKRNADLEAALARVKRLSGLLPICASCKKIRDERDYWRQVDEYVSEHSEAEFTHSICPDCLARLYPEMDVGKA